MKGGKHMNNNSNNDLYFWEPNSIELLGYAKNSIVEARDKVSEKVPEKHLDKLRNAYALLSDVQEYIYNNVTQ